MKRLVAIGAVLAMVLVGSPVSAFTISGTFTDDDGNPHESNIQAIAEIGVTNGCGGTSYCPGDVVTREQMASFLVRALGLQPVSTGPFVDLLPNSHAADINAIAVAGITLGCDSNLFCPTDPVQRDQMASFLARAFQLAPAASFGFTDVPANNPHAANIDAIASAGITLGCGTGLYCPSAGVQRDQMASFLARSLDLEPVHVRFPLYEGLPLTCTKDGLVCSASFSIAYRPVYLFEEGFYQITPGTGAELAAMGSSATGVDLVVDGTRFTLTPGAEVESGTQLLVPFSTALTLLPGSHSLVTQWFLDGKLIQTVNLTVVVG